MYVAASSSMCIHMLMYTYNLTRHSFHGWRAHPWKAWKLLSEIWWHIIAICIITAVITSIKFFSPLTFTLSWDTKARSGTSFTVWYSTDGHDSDPTSPPQGALMVSGLNSTSVTITLPDSDDSCKPYYVWIAGITPNGQQSPYSKRRRVEVCKASGGEKCIPWWMNVLCTTLVSMWCRLIWYS